jgi:hypothetical protein
VTRSAAAIACILALLPGIAAGSTQTLQQRIEAEKAKAAQIQAALHANATSCIR